ncbi:hypothetical protein [Azospirillum agricola]|uniref:hypothetical protein n=1 Tax=Azospirillum agricola TaxID=1720247 RepID=UPI0011774D91|nr:hypothetical protein [Azospirillum agricola]
MTADAVQEAARQFVSCTPAHWPDSTPLSMLVPEGEDEPEDADDPSPLNLGHLRVLAAARAVPAPEAVVEALTDALTTMMKAHPVSTSVAQTDAAIKAHAALRAAKGEG